MSNQVQPGTSKKKASTLYVPQACRGLAGLMVVLYHGTMLVEGWYGIQPLHDVYNFGYSGVHLFFVISGFIIYYAHYNDSNNYKNIYSYLVKRIIRIYPLYLLVFFVWGGWRVFFNGFEVYDFIGNALFFTSANTLVVPVSWTLAHEMVFYCLFALFIANRTLGYAVFCGWFAVVIANHQQGFSAALPLRLANVLFVVGLAAAITLTALAKHLGQAKRESVGFASMALGGALFVATAMYCRGLPNGAAIIDVWGSAAITFGFGLSSAMILLSSLSTTIEGHLRNQSLLMLMGNASYSIYLVHFYIQRMVFNLTRPIDFIWASKSQGMADLLLVIVVLTSVAAGVAIHKTIERPILARLRGLVNKRAKGGEGGRPF